MEPQTTSWSPPPERPAAAGEVHLWLAELTQSTSLLARLERTLSADERERAARFHFRRDAEHFVVARGALRDILGRYLCERPERLRFAYNEFGKPSLAGVHAGGPHRFNLSHSRGRALYAVTLGREVGVDLEFVRPDFAGEEIASAYFSRPEVAALRALPAGRRVEAFFNCWTRKEAFVKARGEGLSLPLDRFAVSLAPGEPARLLDVEGEPGEAARWSLKGLPFEDGYVGALAAESGGWRLRCWRWTGPQGAPSRPEQEGPRDAAEAC